MGTLIDKLNATNATKEEIRQAIERKDVDIPIGTPLKDYPGKIDGIYPDALFERVATIDVHTQNVPSADSDDDVVDAYYEPNLMMYFVRDTNNNNKLGCRTFRLNEQTGTWDSSLHYISTKSRVNSCRVCHNENGFLVTAEYVGSDMFGYFSKDGVSWKQVFTSDKIGYVQPLPTTYRGNEFIVPYIENKGSGTTCDIIFFHSKDGTSWEKITLVGAGHEENSEVAVFECGIIVTHGYRRSVNVYEHIESVKLNRTITNHSLRDVFYFGGSGGDSTWPSDQNILLVGDKYYVSYSFGDSGRRTDYLRVSNTPFSLADMSEQELNSKTMGGHNNLTGDYLYYIKELSLIALPQYGNELMYIDPETLETYSVLIENSGKANSKLDVKEGVITWLTFGTRDGAGASVFLTKNGVDFGMGGGSQLDLQDSDGNSKLARFMMRSNNISAAALQAAYQAGVNSI